MYLSFDVLARELGRNLPIQTYNVTQRQVISDIQVLPIPFLPGQQELKPDTAYLCNYWQLKQFDPHLDLPPICCVVEPYVTADPVFFQNRAVIAVYGATLTDTLLALLNSAYDLGCKSSLATEVSRSLLKCRSIPELVEEGYRALKCPILVTDREQKILCCTSPEKVSSPTYREFFISEYLPVGHPDTELDALWHPAASLAAASGDGHMPAILYKALMVGGAVIGYLHILQLGRPLDEQDISIAELLGNLLTISLWHQQGSRPSGVQTRQSGFSGTFWTIFWGSRRRYCGGNGNLASPFRLISMPWSLRCEIRWPPTGSRFLILPLRFRPRYPDATAFCTRISSLPWYPLPGLSGTLENFWLRCSPRCASTTWS